MSLIPSFILSTLLFCNATVPGGWDGAVFSEGIICEIPYTRFTVSLGEPPLSLKNAAAIFQSESAELKLAAGSLTVSGTSGADPLSAALPGRTDGKKAFSFFTSWKNCAFYATESRSLFQWNPDFITVLQKSSLTAELRNRFSAGMTILQPTNDTDWYLRFPLHEKSSIRFIRDALALRLSTAGCSFEAEGTVSPAFSAALPTAQESALSLLLKTTHTESAFSCTAAPSWYVTPAGSFTDETFQSKASFIYRENAPDNAVASFKADADFVIKQPAAAFASQKRLFSAGLGAESRNGGFSAGVSLTAGKLCPEDRYEDAEFSDAVECTFPETVLEAKVTIRPFKTVASMKEAAPVWAVKAERSLESGSVSYKASFSGTEPEQQEFTLTEERGGSALYMAVTVKNEELIWCLSFSRSW